MTAQEIGQILRDDLVRLEFSYEHQFGPIGDIQLRVHQEVHGHSLSDSGCLLIFVVKVKDYGPISDRDLQLVAELSCFALKMKLIIAIHEALNGTHGVHPH